ncbi:UNVERIFIED_CONTAM: hypothetical protein GTU68_021283, partial [Idotea baltica]|nr:hypothetical protein [Idotea baltica]
PQFYLTAPAPCPYLEGKQERKVFTHLVGHNAPALNEVLTQGGFRRSQNIAYRPACERCQACVSIRVRVDEFQWTKSFKRVWKSGGDIVGARLPPSPSAEQYDLFRDYLEARHENGGMTEMSVLDYAMMVEDTHVETLVLEYRRRGPNSFLTGTDQLSDGLSMVYSFYTPDYPNTALGTYMILDHIVRARKMNLPYVYLGYWVDGSRKMDYKARFKPQEHLGPNGWAVADEKEYRTEPPSGG